MATATTASPPTRLTVDQFWDFVHRPENENRDFELRRGEVIEVSRPTRKHGIVSLNIGVMLSAYAARVKKGYATTNDSGVVLNDDPATVVGPDVAYYTDAQSFEDVPAKWGHRPPVLAVEVLSPTDRMSHVNEKIADFLENGVQVVWLVDYEEQCVTVYRVGQNHRVLNREAELNGEPELTSFQCKVSDFFRLPHEA